jgi:asparagine synthase (glutamine-hydrolysing)
VLLRLLGKRHLPPQLDLKRKQGFSIPLHSWFKGRWGEYLEGVLRDADPLFLNPRAVDRLLAAQRRGYSNTQRIFLLAMLELWRREYAVEGLA